MRWQFLVFFLIMLSAWGLAHYYVVRRLLNPHNLSEYSKRVIWISISILFVLQISILFLNRAYGNTGWAQWLQWWSYLYMGSFALIFPFMVFRDLFVLGEKSMRYLNCKLGKSSRVPVDRERRTLLLKASNMGVLSVSGLMSGIGLSEARKLAQIVKVDIPIKSLPRELQGYKIIQVSDIHVGLTIQQDYLQPIVDAVNELNPDMIAITGDLVDGYVPGLIHQVLPISRFKSQDGTFFVTGNHEYYWDAPAWINAISKMGLEVLNNEHRVIRRGKSTLLVAGVTDYSAAGILPTHASDPQKALENAPQSDVKILLAHQPKSVLTAQYCGFDLQLSGHTHGGQFFPWTLAVGIAHPFPNGLSHYQHTQLYVSRGTGYWGPPMRIGAPSEITLLTLVDLNQPGV